jgi:uncharacterized protein YutD
MRKTVYNIKQIPKFYDYNNEYCSTQCEHFVVKTFEERYKVAICRLFNNEQLISVINTALENMSRRCNECLTSDIICEVRFNGNK